MTSVNVLCTGSSVNGIKITVLSEIRVMKWRRLCFFFTYIFILKIIN